MAQHRNLWIGAGLALAVLLVVSSCQKKKDATPPAGSQPNQTTSAAPPPAATPPSGSPTTANDRTATDEGELKGGENVEGAPAIMSEDAFLAEYKKLEGVKVRPSGLLYRIIESGPANGKIPKVTDKIRVAYKGSLMDGKVFDQTPAGQSSTFALSDTIQGWQEALPLMHVGDAWEIVVPSTMAYGDKGAAGVIPPNSPLVFDIKLFEIVSK
jgi:FKBP-type peptidyl-prolyl cis-trans isomerase